MIRIFTYEIKKIDEVNENIFTQCGIIYGTSFSDAVKRLEEYYGSEYMFSICSLDELSTDDPIVLPRHIKDAVMNGDFLAINEEEEKWI